VGIEEKSSDEFESSLAEFWWEIGKCLIGKSFNLCGIDLGRKLLCVEGSFRLC
jgi:hypothetical protein